MIERYSVRSVWVYIFNFVAGVLFITLFNTNFVAMDLTTILFILSLPFVLLTVYFGTKNDFYESENYKGDGCAHDVKR